MDQYEDLPLQGHFHDKKAEDLIKELDKHQIVPDRMLMHHMVHGGMPERVAQHKLNVFNLQVQWYWQAASETIKKQVMQQISGLFWMDIMFDGAFIRIPYIHEDLICLPTDMEILRAHKPKIFAWVRQFCPKFQIWMDDKSGNFREMTIEELESLQEECDWLSVSSENDSIETCLRLFLDLCWVTPGDEYKVNAFPEDGTALVQITKFPSN